jgi:5-methyltetrahydrofolate--homocysteine methyltransferase
MIKYSRETMNLQFSINDMQRVKQDWTNWWKGTIDHPFFGIEAIDDEAAGIPFTYNEVTPVETDALSAEQILDGIEEFGEGIHWYGGAFPKFWPNYGPGLMAAFLGSNLRIQPDTVWFDPLGVDGLAQIKPCFNPENLWWQQVRKLTTLATERWDERVMVGFTDLGGNLDILASLRGSENLLLDLSDDPEDVLGLLTEITHLWMQYYDQLFNQTNGNESGTCGWSPLWAPGKLYMLQSDFSYMISPRMFKRFVMPDLTACCDFLDYPFYHLDGVGQLNHLDQILSIPNLRGIQWIPGAGQPEPEVWIDVLKKIRDAGKLCQVYVTRTGMEKIVSALGWQGFYFHINEDLMLTASQAWELCKEYQ